MFGSYPIWQLASDSLNLIANVDTCKPQSGSHRTALATTVDERWVTKQRLSQHVQQTKFTAIILMVERNRN